MKKFCVERYLFRILHYFGLFNRSNNIGCSKSKLHFLSRRFMQTLNSWNSINSSFNSARIDLPERNFEYTNFDTNFGSYLSSFNKKVKYAQNTVFIRNLSQRIHRETSSDNAVRTEVGWINFSTLATLV